MTIDNTSLLHFVFNTSRRPSEDYERTTNPCYSRDTWKRQLSQRTSSTLLRLRSYYTTSARRFAVIVLSLLFFSNGCCSRGCSSARNSSALSLGGCTVRRVVGLHPENLGRRVSFSPSPLKGSSAEASFDGRTPPPCRSERKMANTGAVL